MFPLLLALACAPKPSARNAEVASPDFDEINWAQASVRIHMSEHFTRAQAARSAVISGELERAREDLSWLAEHEPFEGVPGGYSQYLQDMRVIAETGAQATDAEGMAACLTGIAVECAGCHQTLNIEPRMPVTAVPPRNTGGIKGHMARHGWVVDQMWAALARPDEHAWKQAVLALREPPMSVYDLGMDDETIERVSPIADGLNALAARAETEVDAATRAATYGEVITHCSECHAIAAGSPVALPQPDAPVGTALPDPDEGDGEPTALPQD